MKIPLDLIDNPKFDIRFYRSKEFLQCLCEDIEKRDIIYPPIVQKLSSGRFSIIDGQNRIACYRKLQRKTIMCDVIDSINEVETIEMALAVHRWRMSHDPVGLSESIQRLKTLGLKQKEICQRLGLSKSYVSKLLTITKLSHSQKLDLAKGKLSIDQAYNLAKTKRDPDLMSRLNPPYRCGICHCKTSFSQIELVQICPECKRKLDEILKQEIRRREHEHDQKELEVS